MSEIKDEETKGEVKINLSERATFIGTGKNPDYPKDEEFIIGKYLGEKFVKAGIVTAKK